MGNIASAKKDGKAQPFVIEYIARYVSITKTQFTDLRNRCYMDMDERRKINRQSFRRNVELCDIKENPDAEILDCLFTIETKGILTADRTVFILKHLNQTAAYFGDSPVTLRQIYKVVDDIFGTLSIISQEGPTLTHDEVVEALCKNTLVKQLVSGDRRKQVTFSSLQRVRREDGSELSTDNSSLPLTPIVRVRLNKIGGNGSSSSGSKSSSSSGGASQDGADSDYSSVSPLRKAWMARAVGRRAIKA